MNRRDDQGLVTYQFQTLTEQGLGHAVFTRLGGVSRGPFATLNVGGTVGDDADSVAENHARIYAHLGLTADRVVTGRQVHGNHVAHASAAEGGTALPSTDGLVTAAPGVALLLRFADCQPLLLYDPAHGAVGLVHAGWRGVALGMAHRAVEAMHAAFGTDPRAIVAGLGPAIGPCCYLVGHDVAAAMGYALPHWRRVMRREGEAWRLDLPGANAQQLAAAGVEQIEQAELCTACHREEFYSHRGDAGLTGRFAAVVHLGLQSAPLPARAAGPEGDEASDASSAPPASPHPPGLPAFGELGESA